MFTPPEKSGEQMEFWMDMPTTGPEKGVALWDRDVQGEAPKPRRPERQGLREGAGV